MVQVTTKDLCTYIYIVIYIYMTYIEIQQTEYL